MQCLGVKGFFNSDNSLRSVGITCALCHSTVDDSLTTGIGHRLDGWANRDLNVGEIVALAPDLSPFSNSVGRQPGYGANSTEKLGTGKFDAELILDGKAFNPQQISNGVVTGTNVSAATLIPPAFGLGRNKSTYVDWLGFSNPLECVCGKPGNAREWDLLRSSIERCSEVSDSRSEWFRKRAEHTGPDHFEARRTSFLSACDSSATTAGREF